jgi:gamma-glutamyltranspeptidase/glutathione hydrolase
VTVTKGAVAAGHAETAAAAHKMLAAGGNAFDAALAAVCTACVCEPALASLGGGGFLLAHRADGDSTLYDFFPQTPGRAGRADEVDFFPITADFGPAQQEFHIGRGSIAVPGLVRGLFAAHRDLCHLPLREIVAPAAALARTGVTVLPYQSYLLHILRPIFGYRAETRALYESPAESGQVRQPGETLINPELGELLDALAREGEDLFYRGEVAERIVEMCQDGGLVTATDLERYQSARRQPLVRSFGHASIATNPPPSSGGILVLFALALWDRQGRTAEARDLARIIKATAKARADVGLADDPSRDSVLGLLDPDLVARYDAEIRGQPFNSRGTTHISVIDGNGNAASLTVSNGEGCGHLIPGTGTMLNNMLGEEDINPRGFYAWQPDTRISSMMAPSLVRRGDGHLVALGSGGSNRIRTALFQVLRHLLDGQLTLAEAVAAPRLHYENGFLNVEPGFPAAEIDAAAAAYPDHKLWDAPNMFFGGVHAVEWDPHRGTFAAIGDRRRDGKGLISAR